MLCARQSPRRRNQSPMTTEHAIGWKPIPWVAALLGFVLPPIGMLYVQRPWLAGAYFLCSVVVGVAAFLSTWAFDSLLCSSSAPLCTSHSVSPRSRCTRQSQQDR